MSFQLNINIITVQPVIQTIQQWVTYFQATETVNLKLDVLHLAVQYHQLTTIGKPR